MGPNPWNNPNRDAALAQIRDLINLRGVNFVKDDDFRARMDAQDTNSTHISFAVDSNYGPAPQLNSYLGTWLLRAANRGSRSVSADGRYVTTTDSQAESGRLTIGANGTYVWETLRGDPPAKWLRGRWRVVAPGEANAWEGGLALWFGEGQAGLRLHGAYGSHTRLARLDQRRAGAGANARRIRQTAITRLLAEAVDEDRVTGGDGHVLFAVELVGDRGGSDRAADAASP